MFKQLNLFDIHIYLELIYKNFFFFFPNLLMQINSSMKETKKRMIELRMISY